MKIRNGFVSNSSSSSFCIYGAYFEMGDLIERVKKMNLLTEEQLEEMEESEEWYDIDNFLSEKTELEIYSDYENECFWIGKSWTSVGDDETGRQFKDGIETEIAKLFGDGLDYDTHEEEINS